MPNRRIIVAFELLFEGDNHLMGYPNCHVIGWRIKHRVQLFLFSIWKSALCFFKQ